MEWFRNLKKWQKGGLIGCAVGLLLACLVILSPSQDSLGEWIINIHGVLYYLVAFGIRYALFGETGGTALMRYVFEPAVIIIFYGLLGMFIGKIQQMVDVYWGWLLTILLALLLVVFYIMNYYA